jgi:hypothetical protein
MDSSWVFIQIFLYVLVIPAKCTIELLEPISHGLPVEVDHHCHLRRTLYGARYSSTPFTTLRLCPVLIFCPRDSQLSKKASARIVVMFSPYNRDMYPIHSHIRGNSQAPLRASIPCGRTGKHPITRHWQSLLALTQ